MREIQRGINLVSIASQKRLRSIFTFTLIAGAVQAAFAAEPTDLGTVGTQVQGSGSSGSGAAGGVRAAASAPTQADLSATQPQSIIERGFIESYKSPAIDYSGIAIIAPSVSGGISPNGPGLGESKVNIRGFADGSFNVTFDGIPFGDTNGPTHHSTAYFPGDVIGSLVVERGPGNASNLGQATFGGSINLFSRDLAAEQTITPSLSMGSWGTSILGARYESGAFGNAGDTRFSINLQQLKSDGARTYSEVQGTNLAIKFQKAISSATLLTINLNHNENRYDQPDSDVGLTKAQTARFGKNYVLSNNPNQSDYFLYNRVQKSTDLNYVRVQSDLGGGWAIDNSAYYYQYTNNGYSTNSASTPALAFAATAIIPGYIKTNQYNVIGNIAKGTRQMESGLLRVGLWAEKADTHRSRYDINARTGFQNNIDAAVAGLYAGANNTVYDQNSGWKQYQPFVEYEWSVNKDLKVTPGLKLMRTDLSINAAVNQTSRTTQNIDKRFTATLPFLTGNYKFAPGWSTYAQYAKGMLVPDISNYQSAGASATDIKPQTSTNYQLGVVHSSGLITFDTDIYYIRFNDKVAQIPASSPAVFFNQGGVNYKGVEAQGTYSFGNGFYAYANGSLNSASSRTTGKQIAGVPNTTTAFGGLYKSESWSGGLIQKRVGRTYALDDEGYKLDPYSTTDFNVAYAMKNAGSYAKAFKVQFSIYNLFDKQTAIAVKPTNTVAGSALYGQESATDTFLYQAGRSYMMTAKVDF